MSWVPFVFGFATSLSILIGGVVALNLKNKINYLIALCAGMLIATVFVDILPEGVEIIGLENLSLFFGLVLISFFTFHLLDKLVFMHGHSHDDEHDEVLEQKESSLGIVSSVGILLHTFLDGLIIGTGFLVSGTTGILIAVAVLLHDFTDGVTTTTIMLRHKQSTKSIYLLLILAGIFTLLGLVISQFIPNLQNELGYLLALFAGLFLYIGASDLLPEIHKERASLKLVASTFIGAGLIVFLKIVLG